jgi:uncharacterized protein YbjT (DUF2867 family)
VQELRIGAADVARVIAEILSEPADHIGQTYPLTGPVSQRGCTRFLGRARSHDLVPQGSTMKGQLAAFGMPPRRCARGDHGGLHQDNRVRSV